MESRIGKVIIALVLLAVLSGTSVSGAPSSSTSASLPLWKECIRDIGHYFVPINTTAFGWARKNNPCGYKSLGLTEVRRKIFYPNQDDMSFTFAGDSTGLRAYIKAVNSFHPPANLPVIKVANAPPFQEHLDTDKITGKKSRIRYYRLMYMSRGEEVVERAILSAKGGMFVMAVGNWDLNWKIQKNMPMPGLVGGVHNFTAAKEYWTTYVQRVLEKIRVTLQKVPKEERPLVIFREQFLPNCASSRFVAKTRKYRQCAPLVRPIVVPLYRRVLAPLAWSMNIPVLPMDHLFRDGYEYCKLDDGLHLNAECMLVELQHLWNAYLLMRTHDVVQGSDEPLPRATTFLDEAKFRGWQDKTGLRTRDVLRSALEEQQQDLLGGTSVLAQEQQAPAIPPPAAQGEDSSPAEHTPQTVGVQPPLQPPPQASSILVDAPTKQSAVATEHRQGTEPLPKMSPWAIFFEGNKLWIVVTIFFVAVSASFGSFVYMKRQEESAASA